MNSVPTQTELSFNPAWRNSRLFADHYLISGLRTRQIWLGLSEDVLRPALAAITAIYHKHAGGLSEATSESVTENDFVQPVLDLLWNEPAGECYQVQPKI